jgi:hypothetical protein
MNTIHIHTTHMNGGHYVVSSNINICTCQEALEGYVSALNQEQADQRLLALAGVVPPAENIGVTINAPLGEANIDLGAATIIRATVTADGQPGLGYPVTATFNNGDQSLVMRDDGQHEDGASGDGVYAGEWRPAHQGACAVVVRAGNCSIFGQDNINVNVVGPHSIHTAFVIPEIDFNEVIGRAFTLQVLISDNFENPVPGSAMSYVRVSFSNQPGMELNLYDDGNSYDFSPNDGLYGGRWTPMPEDPGPCTITCYASSLELGNASTSISGYVVLPSLKIYDGNELNPVIITERLCRIWKIPRVGPIEELPSQMTDANGLLTFEPTQFDIGDDKIRIEISADTLYNARDYHGTVDGIAAIIYLDNSTVNETGPLTYFDIFGCNIAQPVYLRHTTIKFNLTVGIEWDASAAEFQGLETALRRLANNLYDVTDGQATLAKVDIFDNGGRGCINEERFNSSDMQICDVNVVDKANGVAATSRGIIGNEEGSSSGIVKMPRMYYDVDCTMQPILDFILSGLGINWAMERVHPGPLETSYHPGIQALAHELGHYLFYLSDEYKYRKCTSDQPQDDNFGLMDFLLANDPDHEPMFGEMSSMNEYGDSDSDSRRNTWQWCDMHHRSCWNQFEYIFQGDNWQKLFNLANRPSCPIGSSFRNILLPDEHPGYDIPFEGPNNDIIHADVDCGSETNIMLDNSGPDINLVTQWLMTGENNTGMASIYLIEVPLIDQLASNIIDQGYSTPDGRILLFGGDIGEVAMAYKLWFDQTTGQNGISVARQVVPSLPPGDSLITPMVEIMPNHPMTIRAVAQAPGALTLIAQCPSPFNQPPEITLVGPGDTEHSEILTRTGNIYTSSNAILSGNQGHILLGATDDSAHSFIIPLKYRWTIADSGYIKSAYSRDMACSIRLDTTSGSSTCVLIIEYEYLVPEGGLGENSIYVSDFYSISTYPNSGSLPGLNEMTIAGYLPNSGNVAFENIHLFRWEVSSEAWQMVSGQIDTASLTYTAQISQDGLYALIATEYSGCVYIKGDINGNGSANGIDVTYGVSYLKGGSAPPDSCNCPPLAFPFYAAMDVNGNCGANGIDITYFVSYLKGQQPSLLYCADCPPANLMNPPVPAVEPTKKPVLQPDKIQKIKLAE